MTGRSQFLAIDRETLLDYVAKQIDHFFPDGDPSTRERLDTVLDETLDRLQHCMQRVCMWAGSRFHYLHSEKYTVFLYYLANTLYRRTGHGTLCEKLFYANKTLNGFHCFYDADLPDIFLVGHSVGIVLVRQEYPRKLALYQGATIGRAGDDNPELGEELILYPGSAIIGRCRIGPRTVVSPNTVIANRDVPGDCYVFQTGDELVFKPLGKRDIFAEYFV